ncbi:MAG: hypothetical protein WDA24_03625 [Tissierellales bacterium]
MKDAITGNIHWKKDYAHMTEYLQPGLTSKWDNQMKEDLIKEY